MTKTKRPFDPQTQSNIDQWLRGGYDKETKEEVLRLLRDDPQGAIDAFYTNLTFGTGGLRGIVGVGTNRINKYTVMAATQGLANYLKKQSRAVPSVLIGYDSRLESPLFAQEAARVLAGNGIVVHIYRHLRPTPMVSFGCRARKCTAAIMITASHNPPFYNGYKVYWSDGGQVLPPHDQGIIDEVQKITDIDQVALSPLESPLVRWIDEELDREYLATTKNLPLYPDENHRHGKELKVVYSNLHGTGITLIPKILAQWGFSDLVLVSSQAEPDGHFPTVKSANPEERTALKLGIETLIECNGDILLATDPDADRVGVAVRQGNDVQLLTGNEIGAICLEHLCKGLALQKRLSPQTACIKTIVTTPLVRAITDRYGIVCTDVLPGFKYISAQIQEWETARAPYQFLFGTEESYGYLLGTASRDKDAIVSCALLCEVALHAKREGKTLIQLLQELYQTYGIFREQLTSTSFPETREGREKMSKAMVSLRKSPPKAIAGVAVSQVDDYLLHQHKSDILFFTLADGSWITVRPSGTEPKVKFYAGVTAKSGMPTVSAADQHLDELLDAVKKLLN